MVEPRDRWMEEGLRIVAGEGPGSLTIARLASGVRLTKGSFYHHFKDRDDFIYQLLSEWEVSSTEQVILNAESVDATRRIAELGRLTATLSSDRERVIRGWGQVDELVSGFVRRVDEKRQKYVESLIYDAGGDRRKARTLSRLVYSVFIGAPMIYPTPTARDLKEMYAMLERLL